MLPTNGSIQQPQPTMKTAGIDGCKAGWIAVSLGETETNFWLIDSNEKLRFMFDAFDFCLIDIPIGMEEDKSTRTCDDLLRRVLGSEYRSSVFSPPVRAALITSDYQAGSSINFAKTGKKLSKQSWNITPKIKQVDELLQADKRRADRVRESHPELLFKKLNRGGEPLSKKKTEEGIAQRLSLLTNADQRLAEVYKSMRATFKKSQAKDDDLLDALVLAWTAYLSRTKPLRTLPIPAEIDRTGLPMAIHFV